MSRTTRKTIATLAQQRDVADARARKAEKRAEVAATALAALGYAEKVTELPVGLPFHEWRPDQRVAETKRREAEQQKKIHERDIEAAAAKAREDGRREALRTVIDALELKQYGAGEKKSSSIVDSLLSFSSILTGEGPRTAGVDRFWDDLCTALDVREERRAQADRDATERKIAGLAERDNYSLRFSFPVVNTSGIVFGLADDTATIVGVDPAGPEGPKPGVKKQPKKAKAKGAHKPTPEAGL